MVMKVSVADLINSDLLKPGTGVILRTLEGVITEQGLIRASGANGLGVVDYRTPTAWSRVVCKINSSGWRQIKLKENIKMSLYELKLKYIEKKGGDASREDGGRPAKRPKLTHKAAVPNTAQIPQQIQFITSPLQATFNQQHQQQLLSLPMAIVQPPAKPAALIGQSADGTTDAAAVTQAGLATSAANVAQVQVPAPMEQQTPAHQPQAGYMKFKLAPPPVKTKMLELLVYVEDPGTLPFMVNTSASGIDALHYVLMESFPQFRSKPFDIGVWSDQWGEFVKPPQSWEQFPNKSKIIVKTFGLKWTTREYEPPAAGQATSPSGVSTTDATSVNANAPAGVAGQQPAVDVTMAQPAPETAYVPETGATAP